jgi:hypothetical protein
MSLPRCRDCGLAAGVKGLDSGNLNREIVENTNAYCVLKQERIAGAAKPGIEIVGIDVLVDLDHHLADRA